MTPISHAFFGMTAGTLFSTALQKHAIPRRTVIFSCILGSVAPDIDVVSLAFNHRIYFGDKWYSHHGLTHSIIGGLLLGLLFMIFLHPVLTRRTLKRRVPPAKWFFLFSAFATGALVHLPCDMITLPGPWKGIPLLAPFSWRRFGGWAHIPWKDYFMIYMSLAAFFLFAAVGFLETLLKKRTPVLPSIAIVLLLVAVYHLQDARFRNYAQWETFQKRLIGARLHRLAETSERKLFTVLHMLNR